MLGADRIDITNITKEELIELNEIINIKNIVKDIDNAFLKIQTNNLKYLKYNKKIRQYVLEEKVRKEII